MKSKISINYLRLFRLLFIFLLVSCSKNSKQIVKAELTFPSISFASAYGANDVEYKKLVQEIDSTLKNIGDENNEKVKLYKYFSKLKNHNLLRSPYIFLHFDEDSIMTVYLSESQYKKVKHLKHIDLYKENKKVVLKLEVEKRDNNIFYSNNIINISKVEEKSRSDI